MGNCGDSAIPGIGDVGGGPWNLCDLLVGSPTLSALSSMPSKVWFWFQVPLVRDEECTVNRSTLTPPARSGKTYFPPLPESRIGRHCSVERRERAEQTHDECGGAKEDFCSAEGAVDEGKKT